MGDPKIGRSSARRSFIFQVQRGPLIVFASGLRLYLGDPLATRAAQRSKLGLAEKFGSCHTALISGYVLEGHVPAQDIRRLLKERPRALGLSVPGMPVGSPGMDGPAYGGRKDPYAVLLVQRDGSSSVYQSYV